MIGRIAKTRLGAGTWLRVELLQDLKGNTEQQKHQKSPKQCVTKSTEELSVIEAELVESTGLSPQLVREILEWN